MCRNSLWDKWNGDETLSDDGKENIRMLFYTGEKNRPMNIDSPVVGVSRLRNQSVIPNCRSDRDDEDDGEQRARDLGSEVGVNARACHAGVGL